MAERAGGITPDRAPDQDFPIAIATLPATARQRQAAVGVIMLLVVVAALVAPFAATPLPRVDAFVPVLQTVLALADFITAILIVAQYVILPQRALLAVAAAYLCSASFAFLQTLAFPGGYAPQGLLGDGTNSAAWFFVYWHVTYPLGILVYALLKDAPARADMRLDRSAELAIAVSAVCVFAVVAALTWLATAGIGSLPVFYRDSVILQTNLGNQVNVALLFWYAIVFVVLLARRRTVLDVWLIVILAAWMPNFLIAALASSVRFSLGWYASRGFATVASFMLLAVLLTEMTVLYSRLANAFSLLRRERSNRLMSIDAATAAIAHEVRTPLGAIALNASAALAHVGSTPADLEEVKLILRDIEADTLRASDVISGVRALFKSEPGQRIPVSLEALARQALRFSEPDLLASRVVVSTDFRAGQAEVQADPVQLQQVILNLIRNAVDAMGGRAIDDRYLSLSSELRDSATAVLTVRDAGAGIAAEDHDRVFDAFFTRKAAGMGLGLAISRSIVEAHGGALRLVASGPQGSVFEVALPISGAAAGS